MDRTIPPPDRHHQRAARALEHAGDRQHRQARRDGAGDGGEGEDRDRGREDPACAETVGQPAADRDEHGDGEHVRGDGDVHRDRGDVEALRDVRRGRRDHRAVEDLHEQRARDEQRQSAVDPPGVVAARRGRGPGSHGPAPASAPLRLSAHGGKPEASASARLRPASGRRAVGPSRCAKLRRTDRRTALSVSPPSHSLSIALDFWNGADNDPRRAFHRGPAARSAAMRHTLPAPLQMRGPRINEWPRGNHLVRRKAATRRPRGIMTGESRSDSSATGPCAHLLTVRVSR
jgi:hypothetical protein